MPIYEITAPDGKVYEVEGKGTEAEALAHFKANFKPKNEGTVSIGGYDIPKIKNPMLATLAGVPLASAVGETVKGLGALTQLGMPETGQKMVDFGQNVVQKAKEVEPISATGGQIGSYLLPGTALAKGLRAALPANLAGRVGAETLAGGALAGATTPGTAEERTLPSLIGGGISGAFPLLGSTIKAITPTILGLTTGTGAEPIKQAFKSGQEGGASGQMFLENLRKKVDPTDILDKVSANLNQMGKDLSSSYRSGMVNIKNDKAVLDFTGINQTLQNVEDMFKFKGQAKNEKAVEEITKAKDTIDQWKKLDPIEYHTPEGLDALKQKIGGILEDIDFKNTGARRAVGDIYNSIKTEINKQAPTYAEVMKKYHDGLDQISEIRKTFSQTGKAATDTQMRKLQSVMRDNVNTNYGNRMNQMQMLEQQGGQQVMPGLSGQALSSLAPRGLSSMTPVLNAGAALATSNPVLAGALPFQSPRLMGEAAYYAGKGSKLMPPLTKQQELARALMLQQKTQGVPNE